jgi:hypothetical protein
MGNVRAIRLIVAMALTVPASVAVWAVSGPASAATGASCSTLTGNDAKTSTMLSGCAPAADNGGSATGVTKTGKGTSGTSTLTWAGKHGVTTLSFSYKLVTKNEKCGTSVVKGKKTNNLEAIETGKVLTSTGTASKDIKAGQATTATVCINASTGAEGLLKATKFVL